MPDASKEHTINQVCKEHLAGVGWGLHTIIGGGGGGGGGGRRGRFGLLANYLEGRERANI